MGTKCKLKKDVKVFIEFSQAFINKQERLRNQPGNRAYRRRDQAMARKQKHTSLISQINRDEINSSELRAVKVQNRIKKAQSRKAEREATAVTGEKMKKKRLKKMKAYQAKLDKKAIKRRRYNNKNS